MGFGGLYVQVVYISAEGMSGYRCFSDGTGSFIGDSCVLGVLLVFGCLLLVVDCGFWLHLTYGTMY